MRSAVNFKVRTLLILYAQIINKHLTMNASMILESLTEMPQHFKRPKYTHKKIKIDILAVQKYIIF